MAVISCECPNMSCLWETVVSVVYQGHGSEVIGWKCDGDPQPGEKVLQDIKERRGQERRLQEIQQQLEILGQGQEMNVSSKQSCSFTHSHNKTHAHVRISTALCIITPLRAPILRHVYEKLLHAHSSFSVILTGGQWNIWMQYLCLCRLIFFLLFLISLLSLSLTHTL